MSKRSSVIEGDLRIDQLNELLDELSKKGSKLYAHMTSPMNLLLTSISREHQKRIFSQLFLKCTPGELRWVIKIVLKGIIGELLYATCLTHPQILTSV
jgi:DNA ligase 4